MTVLEQLLSQLAEQRWAARCRLRIESTAKAVTVRVNGRILTFQLRKDGSLLLLREKTLHELIREPLSVEEAVGAVLRELDGMSTR
jgi:hypothetical protein